MTVTGAVHSWVCEAFICPERSVQESVSLSCSRPQPRSRALSRRLSLLLEDCGEGVLFRVGVRARSHAALSASRDVALFVS